MGDTNDGEDIALLENDEGAPARRRTTPLPKLQVRRLARV
jgi:hypothetical protein